MPRRGENIRKEKTVAGKDGIMCWNRGSINMCCVLCMQEAMGK